MQTTDGRYDGADGSVLDGVLSDTEAKSALGALITDEDRLSAHLLATLLNLGDHRIASTMTVSSTKANAVGVTTVREAVEAATALLDDGLPATTKDYVDVILVLDEINKGKGLAGP